MKHAKRSGRFAEAFGRVPLAAQFVLALSALIVAGFAVALSVISYAEYSQSHWTPDRVWVELWVFSTVTAVALVRAFKRRWRRARFWATFTGVMLARTAIYVLVLRQLSGPPPVVLFAVVTMLDIQVWMVVLYWLNYGRPGAMR